MWNRSFAVKINSWGRIFKAVDSLVWENMRYEPLNNDGSPVPPVFSRENQTPLALKHSFGKTLAFYYTWLVLSFCSPPPHLPSFPAFCTWRGFSLIFIQRMCILHLLRGSHGPAGLAWTSVRAASWLQTKPRALPCLGIPLWWRICRVTGSDSGSINWLGSWSMLHLCSIPSETALWLFGPDSQDLTLARGPDSNSSGRRGKKVSRKRHWIWRKKNWTWVQTVPLTSSVALDNNS